MSIETDEPLHEACHSIELELRGIGIVSAVAGELRVRTEHGLCAGGLTKPTKMSRYVDATQILPCYIAGAVGHELAKYPEPTKLSEQEIDAAAAAASRAISSRKIDSVYRSDWQSYRAVLRERVGELSLNNLIFLAEVLYESCRTAAYDLSHHWQAVLGLRDVLKIRRADRADAIKMITSVNPNFRPRQFIQLKTCDLTGHPAQHFIPRRNTMASQQDTTDLDTQILASANRITAECAHYRGLVAQRIVGEQLPIELDVSPGGTIQNMLDQVDGVEQDSANAFVLSGDDEQADPNESSDAEPVGGGVEA